MQEITCARVLYFPTRVDHCINARRARATAFLAGREGGLSEPRARLVNVDHTHARARLAPQISNRRAVGT